MARTASKKRKDDAPELTKEIARNSKRGRDFFAEKGMEVPRGPGRPRLENPKQQVTLRLDADVVDHFKHGGRGWQTRINDTLSEVIHGTSTETAKTARSVKALRSAATGRFVTKGSAAGRRPGAAGKKRA